MSTRFDKLFDAYHKSIVSEARKAPSAAAASPLDMIKDILASAQPGDETDVLERIKEASEIGLNSMAKKAEAEMVRPEEGEASAGGWLEDYADPMDYFQHDFDMQDVASMWDSVILYFGEGEAAKNEAVVECDAAGKVSAPAIEKNKKLQKFYMDYVTYGEGAGAVEDFKSATKSFLDYIHFLVVSKKAKTWLAAAQRAVKEAQRAAAYDTSMKIANVSYDEAAQKITFTLKY